MYYSKCYSEKSKQAEIEKALHLEESFHKSVSEMVTFQKNSKEIKGQAIFN